MCFASRSREFWVELLWIGVSFRTVVRGRDHAERCAHKSCSHAVTYAHLARLPRAACQPLTALAAPFSFSDPGGAGLRGMEVASGIRLSLVLPCILAWPQRRVEAPGPQVSLEPTGFWLSWYCLSGIARSSDRGSSHAHAT
eukprot:2967992-Alexandrium_andersonii.AAC.1